MSVSWEDIRQHVEDCYEINGEVERAATLSMAEADGISDDVTDALDAIGSRIFRGDNAVELTKDFLVQAGHIVA